MSEPISGTTDAPSIVALAGPNGAGKSTSGPALLRDTLDIRLVVNADVIARGLAAFAPEAAAIRAGRVMLSQIEHLAERREDFAFETTLAGRAYVPRLRRLIATGYELHLVFLWLPDPEMAVERVARRVAHGGHGLPEETIRERFRRGLRNFFGLYVPLATTWRLYDSSGHNPSLIARGKRSGGELVHDTVRWQRIRRHAD